PNFDKNTGINFDVANDERQLYLILRIADNSLQQQILQNGLEIWINTAGKKKETTGVTFPLPMKRADKATKNNSGKMPLGNPEGSNAETDMPEGGPDGQGTPDDRQQATATESDKTDHKRQQPDFGMIPQNELILSGFLIDNGKQSIHGCPVRPAMSMDKSGCLIYELAIPFTTFFKEKLDASDQKTIFCIGFVVKAGASSGEKSDMSGGMGGPDGGMGGPMGGGPGGGMGGGPMGGGGMMGGPMGGMDMNSNTTQSASSEKKYWFKVKPFVP
ncbi:MAG: hypothetical protein Q8914_08400, partial [Bacteroidota bacterium]|nr:hypothetical protein [Bacteroidota bacterium]